MHGARRRVLPTPERTIPCAVTRIFFYVLCTLHRESTRRPGGQDLQELLPQDVDVLREHGKAVPTILGPGLMITQGNQDRNHRAAGRTQGVQQHLRMPAAVGLGCESTPRPVRTDTWPAPGRPRTRGTAGHTEESTLGGGGRSRGTRRRDGSTTARRRRHRSAPPRRCRRWRA